MDSYSNLFEVTLDSGIMKQALKKEVALMTESTVSNIIQAIELIKKNKRWIIKMLDHDIKIFRKLYGKVKYLQHCTFSIWIIGILFLTCFRN